jgi:diguanylate cyclase (GGDEF)-like protein
VRSRPLMDPVHRSRTRRVGAVLAATLVVLMTAAMFGAWSQARLMDSMSEASSETAAHQEASRLVTQEQFLLQATVADGSRQDRPELLGTQPRVIDALQRIADSPDRDGAEFRRVLLEERLFQYGTAQILTRLDRGDRRGAVRLAENLEPRMHDIRGTVLSFDTQQGAANAAQIRQARSRSRLLSTSTIALFLLGLIVLIATSRISRADRRMIEKMAAEDALTGLPNRTAFTVRTQHALREAASSQRQPTVLMVDLDGFKDVNDTLGHAVGDLLLVEVAQRLRTCVRDDDVVARFGGDEFAFLLRNIAPSVGEDTAERIAAVLERPFVIDGVALDVEASVGITTAMPGQDVTDVVRDADVAMYVAKENHFGYSRFEEQAGDSAATRVSVMGSIRRALDSGEIVLHFQPKIEVGTGRLIGAEALARWQHPTRGLLPPSEFIPVLERTSLVHPFNSYVLAHALKQARVWMDDLYPIPVAVNVTARCLLDPGFPEEIAQTLLAAGVPGELLCLEITESTIIANPESTIDVLRRVRALGVKTSIDDFGTGYASMANLKMLPVDEVKVDHSFVHDMVMGGTDQVMVGSAISLGHNLGLTVVAEGVEDRATLDALEQLGCDVAQGFYFAQALAPGEFSSWAARYSPFQTTEVG